MLHQLNEIMKTVNADKAKITVVRQNDEMRLCLSIQANTIADVNKLSGDAAKLANALQMPVIISGTPDELDANANDQLMAWSDSYLPVNEKFNSLVDSKALLDVANAKVKKKSSPKTKNSAVTPIAAPASNSVKNEIKSDEQKVVPEKEVVVEHEQESDLLSFLAGENS